MRDELGVAVGAKLVPLGVKLCFDFRIIEEFAVEDDADGPVFVADGLFAVGESNDGKPAIGKADAGAKKIAVLIRPAMRDRVCHPPHDLRLDRRRFDEVDDSRNAAHEGRSKDSHRTTKARKCENTNCLFRTFVLSWFNVNLWSVL